MMSGCKDYEYSSEVYNTATREFNGQFTAAFIACFSSIGGNINILLLYRNICMFLQKQTSTQLPTLSSSSSVPNMNISKAISAILRPSLLLRTTMRDIMNAGGSVYIGARNSGNNHSENRNFRKMTFL
jgi:hypothetical protein